MKNFLWCDLHVHTNYSYDNSHRNTMEKNILVAIERGLDVVCFTDHIECCHIDTFCDFPFEQRLAEVEQLRAKYGNQLKILQGYEMGSPHRHPKELEFLRSLQPDLIIGSVHYPCYYHNIEGRLSQTEYQKLYDEEVRKLVEFGGFEILGHADMPKKYNANYVADKDMVLGTMEICAKKGIIPEMNTSSLRQTNVAQLTAETMVSAEAIRHYANCGGKYVVINSDSHGAGTLGDGFEVTRKQIDGIVKLCYFEKGKLVEAK